MSDLDILDVDELLLEVGAGDPCGANLEYDPLFLELERALQGKPEVEYGAVVTAATPSDWKQVQSLALQLLTRTRDLRVAMAMARALLHTHGIAGFSDGLKLIERLLDNRWDSIHPQLDPHDGNDPTLRINTLATLLEFAVLLAVKDAPIVASRAHGTFFLRDVDVAAGEASTADDKEKPSTTLLEAALSESDPAEIEATARALDAAWNSTVRIEAILTERVGAAQALDLSPLAKLLKRGRDFVQQRLATAVAAAGDDPAIEVVQTAPVVVAAAAADSGAIASREDVVRMLDKMCAYFDEHEPSNPIPLLLQRALRLVDKSFVEILADLAPDGLHQIHQISGTQQQG